jgi:hypothetical protein
MTTPIVTEITRRLEPIAHDPFIDGLRAALPSYRPERRGRGQDDVVTQRARERA